MATSAAHRHKSHALHRLLFPCLLRESHGLCSRVHAGLQVRCAMGGSSSSNGTSNPQEMLKIFRETQENMMELNRSRLAALEEVKTLRARVALLGEQ